MTTLTDPQRQVQRLRVKRPCKVKEDEEETSSSSSVFSRTHRTNTKVLVICCSSVMDWIYTREESHSAYSKHNNNPQNNYCNHCKTLTYWINTVPEEKKKVAVMKSWGLKRVYLYFISQRSSRWNVTSEHRFVH